MSTLSEALRLPTDSIACVPEVTASDVPEVVGALESIIRKCLYSIRLRLVQPLGVLITILYKASSLQPERFCRGLLQPAEEGICLDVFCELAAQILSNVNSDLRLQIPMEAHFEVVQTVCASSTLKEKAGAVMGQILLGFMHDFPQHQDDYRIPRYCASALITLMRGSKANKNRLGAECARIASCLEGSSDLFFQMQCVEILFRLHTHNKVTLAQAHMEDYVRRGIMALSNDSTLLLGIQNFLDGYNAEFNQSRMKQFTALRMEVRGVEFCSHTTVYFSPLLLVVILPGGAGENVTIPYEHIRSVKLSKDRKLGLRLSIIPDKLALMMDPEEEGGDTLHIFLTQSTLTELRSSSIHEWIADRKRNAPARPTPPPPAAKSKNVSRAPSQQQKHLPIAERPANQPRESLKGPSQPRMDSLAEIHSAAALKAARHREEQMEQLQGVSDGVQDLLAQMSRLNARDRDAFEAEFREDMTVVRQAEAALKESAADCVQNLNAELEEMQVLGSLLKVEAEKVRARLNATLHKSEKVEEDCLLRVKNLVDTNMEQMEATLERLSSNANPLYALTQHLADFTDVDSARLKQRRLEHT